MMAQSACFGEDFNFAGKSRHRVKKLRPEGRTIAPIQFIATASFHIPRRLAYDDDGGAPDAPDATDEGNGRGLAHHDCIETQDRGEKRTRGNHDNAIHSAPVVRAGSTPAAAIGPSGSDRPSGERFDPGGADISITEDGSKFKPLHSSPQRSTRSEKPKTDRPDGCYSHRARREGNRRRQQAQATGAGNRRMEAQPSSAGQFSQQF